MKWLPVYLLMLSTHILPGQTDRPHLYYRHFTVNDGLPSNETYFVLQDLTGYIWICTDNGVSRFDGTRFRNYGEKEGLCSNVIFGCREDEHGNLWMYSFTGELSKYNRETDRFECPSYNDSLSQALKGEVIKDLVFYRDTLFVVTNTACLEVFFPAGGKAHIRQVKLPRNTLSVRVLGNREVIAMQRIGKSEAPFNLRLTGAGLDTTWNLNMKGASGPNITGMIDGEVYVLFGNNLFSCDPVTKTCTVSTLPFVVTPSLQKSGKGWLCGSFHNGLWEIKKDKGKLHFEQLLNGVSISGAIQDRQGGIWASSLEDGVFLIPTAGVFTCSGKTAGSSEKVSYAYLYGDTLFYGTYDGSVYMMDNLEQDHPRRTQLLSLREEIKFIRPVNSNELLIRSGDYYMYNMKRRSFHPVSEENTVCMQLGPKAAFTVNVKKDTLRIQSCTNNRLRSVVLDTDWKYGRVRARMFSATGKIWLGTSFDLVLVDTAARSILPVGKMNGFHRFDVRCFIPLGGDTLVAGSTRGIFVLAGTRIIRRLGTAEGLSDNKVLYLLRENDVLWVATARGIDCVKGLLNGHGTPLVLSVTRNMGIDVCPVSHLAGSGKYLLAGTQLGMFFFDRKVLAKSALVVQPQITGVRIRGLAGSYRKSLALQYDQNDVRISFSGMNFRNAFFNMYRYQLHGNDAAVWQYTQDNEVAFTSLSPGTYHFRLQAMNTDGSWSPLQADLDIVIHAPFWYTWWFISLLMLSGLLIIYYFLRNFIKVNMLKSSLIEAKVQALGMQLNPHFVFNVLNSVSFHMARNDVKHTLRFLGKFARLMRVVFRNSQYSMIPVEEELKALKLYLELESGRLETGFIYRIKVGEEINTRTCLIPSLLLQPLIENAIWHGLAHRDEPGEIDIYFNRTAKGMQVEIKDNGVGRAAAAQIKPPVIKERHSLAVIEERLSLLGSHYKTDVFIHIEDLFRDNAPAGTKVLIHTPFLTI